MEGVAIGKVSMKMENINPHTDVKSLGICFSGASGLASNIFYSTLLVEWEASDSVGGRGEEYDLSLTLLDESALGG